MKKRLFIYTTLIIFAGFLSFLLVTVHVTGRNNLNIAKNMAVETARICAGLFRYYIDFDEFVRVGDGTRITVISSDGEVLADSHPAQYYGVVTENHLLRPEILAAASGFPAVQVRHSDTLGAYFIYYALRVETDESYVFIRTAIAVAQIDAYLLQSLPMLLALLVALALACFFVVRDVAGRILRPFYALEGKLRQLSNNKYTPTATTESYPEIEKITREIDDIAQVLQSGMDTLRDEKDKLSYILNSIGDGIFVVDENSEIALVNSAALELFNAAPDVSGKKLNYLLNEKTLQTAIDDCVTHAKSALFELTLHGKIHLTTVKRLPVANLTMVVLADITESRENAKRREDFFANASHELKTPLTAINGFNELTALNNTDENLAKYISGISRETARMMSLISDMLKLSELESMKEITNPVPISLASTVVEICEAISPAVEEKGITIEATGDAEVLAEPNHIFETVKNIVENAVRYNNKNGKVSIKIESGKTARLTISDNGIGISPGEKAKIFERFYRVEKSRSAHSGGTGLGLAIVKHTCALYGWKLSLKSKLGIGTDVIIEF